MHFLRRHPFCKTLSVNGFGFLLALGTTSCQLPTELNLSPATSNASGRTPSLTINLDVGLKAPTWDQRTRELAALTLPKVKVIRDSYFQIKTSKKVIAITFDDGPQPTNTPRLLDMLKKRHIKATFFVVGEMVRNNPQILRRMIAEGHEIGNHTVRHVTLSRLSNDALEKELKAADQTIFAATGVKPKLMRPPGGAIKKSQEKWIHAHLGYSTILWSVDPEDWKRPGVDVVTRRLVEGAFPGAILLAHDLHKPTVDAMPSTLDQLLAKGYQFVTVSQLIAMDETKN